MATWSRPAGACPATFRRWACRRASPLARTEPASGRPTGRRRSVTGDPAFDRQPFAPLLRKFGKAPRPEPVASQPRHGVERQHAIGTATADHDLLSARQRIEMPGQILERDVDRPRHVPRTGHAGTRYYSSCLGQAGCQPYGSAGARIPEYDSCTSTFSVTNPPFA